MHDRSPNAYGFSLALHGGAVALAILFAFGLAQQPRPAPAVFELVAGGGDNYAATAAPRLGVPGGITVPIPKTPAEIPRMPEIAPEPAPQTPPAEQVAAPAAVPAPTTVAPAKTHATKRKAVTRKPPSIATRLGWTMRWRTKVETRKNERALARERAREAAREMTYQDYLRQHGLRSGSTPSRVARVDAKGIAEGVEGGSVDNQTGGAGGKALTRGEEDLMDAYFTMLKERLMENIERPTDIGGKLSVQVGFFVAADGSISNVRILSPSGNDDFDHAVLTAFHRIRPIGPRPDRRSEDVQVTFDSREDPSGN